MMRCGNWKSDGSSNGHVLFGGGGAVVGVTETVLVTVTVGGAGQVDVVGQAARQLSAVNVTVPQLLP
jgi:hypothetical protein